MMLSTVTFNAVHVFCPEAYYMSFFHVRCNAYCVSITTLPLYTTTLTLISHIASPLTINVNDVANDLLKPAMQGTVGVLQSALRSPSVKAVAVTSSFGSVFDPKFGWRAGYTYSAVHVASSMIESHKLTKRYSHRTISTRSLLSRPP